MNAIQPSRPPLQPIPRRQVAPRPKRHLRQRSYQVMALETTAKIGVNIVISVAAVTALVRLLPYHWSQQAKLQEINTELRQVEARVNALNVEFSRNFDPRQAKSIMQEQGYRFDPNQRPIMLIKPKAVEVEQVESSP
ncbi:hypothetical protein [Fischerella thermalis]|jgi:hypothetical protein|uniref:Cell division protein FtsL n=3 Tax=Fischerella TaxID=1190 RepID=G6FWT4_9CYAN|nr:hypothetical protein [Fischerella thermalis]PLZ83541.1 hypothetical protein CBP16_03585 [Fischerella thermalis WC217]PMB03003.1 hypothetical protein CEN49_24330 [Fischerella thermalis CCMEE 5273]PMB09418.1 hypothetical protein CI592_06365 [Fischerella thermalis CCMEE 5328]PMB24928.1 hypothetical protein CEN47_17405 [Fischerella thermalis CCMEE 5319]PMB45682.1 hypothetical protein CEN40_11670 [Fischerella thermalis CCMEE 5205]